jgi:hypothetical protein
MLNVNTTKIVPQIMMQILLHRHTRKQYNSEKHGVRCMAKEWFVLHAKAVTNNIYLRL